jgi:hypothetical protein
MTMTHEEAAKYMIVAWVKDWNLYTYLQVVTGEKKPDVDGAHTRLEWLPTGRVSFVAKSARRFIADNFPRLNDRLWDAKDNAERLALYKQVMHPVGANHKLHIDPARMALRKENGNLRRAYLAEQQSTEAMRKGSGHHWNVCK